MKQRLEEKKSMNARFVILAALVLVGSLSRTAAGAVKMDPELTSRLSATPATRQLGVILSFEGPRVARTAAGALKMDPELPSRLSATPATKQLGVILTFNGQRVTDAQVNAVKALGITMGVRMRNFPIMGVNATPTQIRQMANLAGLRSIYLNTQLQLYMNQTRPIIGVTRLQTDSTLTARNHGLPFSGRGVTIAIDDSGIDGSHADVKFDPINPMSGKTIQNVIVNPNDQDGLVVRTNALGNVMAGGRPATYVEKGNNTVTQARRRSACAG